MHVPYQLVLSILCFFNIINCREYEQINARFINTSLIVVGLNV